ncbi:MAG: RNA-splicing ligase RtcB [Bacteroidetes bacterium RIFCSPLOWO2_12_FULL_37_12]|nr:MAG: RNA-splicing ligase RtcB [Bacteroidetes bacterium RIFCSPLOWO2_12_FULL_37_12]
MPSSLTIFGQEIIDANAIEQLKNCLNENSIGVLTADAHYGYGHPIGGVVGYKDKISLSGVGFDIACGNKAVMTNLMAKDIDTPKIMIEIVRQIGFGVGRPNPNPVDHPVFDKIANAEFHYQRELLKLAREQLGTVGGGNHFIDLFEDEAGRLWIGVHFGSRGFGYKTTMGFIAISQGKSFRATVQEGPMNEPPILFDATSETGIDYIAAIQLAGEYAYAGRNTVVEKVLEILGATSIHEVHIHHNFAWKEEHFGEKYWVVRKGCTPAFPAQQGFVGASMGDDSVIIEGIDSEKSKQALYSTIHGAGRVMSRRKAAGKKKWKHGRLIRANDGVVNFEAVKAQLKQKGIVLRGGAADEAPEVYKKLDEVLKFHEGTIKILHRLKPIGVAMADDRSYDPYKD